VSLYGSRYPMIRHVAVAVCCRIASDVSRLSFHEACAQDGSYRRERPDDPQPVHGVTARHPLGAMAIADQSSQLAVHRSSEEMVP